MINKMKTIYILLLIISVSDIYAQDSKTKNLESEMLRLKINTALIVESQAIDEYPLWSPESDFIACNVMGKWYKVSLTNIELAEATWHGKTIGIVSDADPATSLTDSEKSSFEKVSVFNAREVTTSDGTKIELKENNDFSISLIITKKGKKSNKLWTSGGENCHSLVLSPDEKYVAYLCEMNGLFIMKLK